MQKCTKLADVNVCLLVFLATAANFIQVLKLWRFGLSVFNFCHQHLFVIYYLKISSRRKRRGSVAKKEKPCHFQSVQNGSM